MGFYIVLRGRKKPWRLQFRERVEGKETAKELGEKEFARLGFRSDMTIEQAKLRKDVLNAQVAIKRQEKSRIIIGKRLEAEAEIVHAFLNPVDVQEFEETILFAKREDKKKAVAFRSAKRCLSKLKLTPQEYFQKRQQFYSYFIRNQVSLSYSTKLISLINQWGEFQAMKYGFYFKGVPYPTGADKIEIADAYFEKNPEGRTSKPLTPEVLESRRGHLPDGQYDWNFLGVWLGLRGKEIDSLKLPSGPRTWWFEDADAVDGSTVPVLVIYQSKLANLPHYKRVKRIPLFLPEHTKCREIILSGDFNRPSSARHLKNHLGGKYYTNAGRKGFSLLMRKHGQDQTNYSRWLGHTSVQRTETNYEQREVIQFKKIEAK